MVLQTSLLASAVFGNKIINFTNNQFFINLTLVKIIISLTHRNNICMFKTEMDSGFEWSPEPMLLLIRIRQLAILSAEY